VKTKVIILMMLSAGAVFAQISIGIRIGAPPPPRVIRVQPECPGAGYSWIGGYWYPLGNRYKWHEGYWTRPVYTGAHWVEPHHDGQRYFEGYWDGDRGHVSHDHKWDKGHDHDRDRDYNHDHDHDHDHNRDHDR
jgi:hypothetical protein